MRIRGPSRGPSPRRGSVLVWVVVGLGIIIGILAIGLDGGRMLDERHRAQAVADAAALAAGDLLYQGYTANRGTDQDGLAAKAALQAAADNGYANDGTNSTVTVNIPPASGTFKDRPEYAEVIIKSYLKASFGALFTGSDLPVQARSVVCGRPRKIGILVLDPRAPCAFWNEGQGTVQVVAGSIVVNSSDRVAYKQSGTNVVVAETHEIVGGYTATGGGIAGRIYTGVPPTPDPLRTFPDPDPSAYPVRSNAPLKIKKDLPGDLDTLQPGVYRGGIQLTGKADVTLAPGVYILDGGGFVCSGKAQVSGDQVLIYNTAGSYPAGPIQIANNSAVTLTAPTSGTYKGICIFQDRSVAETVTISGNASAQITGAVYAANAPVELSGSGTSDTLGGSYICRTLHVSGNGSFRVDLGSNRPNVPDVKVVE